MDCPETTEHVMDGANKEMEGSTTPLTDRSVRSHEENVSENSLPVDVGQHSTLPGETASSQDMVSTPEIFPRDKIIAVNKAHEKQAKTTGHPELHSESQGNSESTVQPEAQVELQAEIQTELQLEPLTSPLTRRETQTQVEPRSTQPNTPTRATSQVQAQLQPEAHSDARGQPDPTENDGLLTPFESPDAAGDRPLGEAPGKPDQSKKRTRGARAPFEKSEDNLPDPNASNLTNEEITAVILHAPSIRRRYSAYFNRNGTIRSQYHPLVLAKSANGDYILPEAIIKSNVHHWKGPLDPSKSKTPYGTGRKHATRATPVKRTATSELEGDSPPKKRAKAETTKTKAKSGGSEPSAERKGKKQSGDGSRSQGKLRDSHDRPTKTNKSVQQSDTNADDFRGIASKSALATDVERDLDTAAAMGTLLDSQANDWFKEQDENDVELLNNTELLLLILWLNTELRTLQYSLVGALRMDELEDEGRHKEMIEEILRAMHQLSSVCNELARHLQLEVAMKK